MSDARCQRADFREQYGKYYLSAYRGIYPPGLSDSTFCKSQPSRTQLHRKVLRRGDQGCPVVLVVPRGVAARCDQAERRHADGAFLVDRCCEAVREIVGERV